MKKRYLVIGAIGLPSLITTGFILAVTLSRRKYHGLIVIIGAGIAGASAAAELKRNGQRFLIVETGSQVGGRITNARFANISAELGENWILGYTQGDELEKLASDITLKGVPIDFRDVAFYKDGKKVNVEVADAKFRSV